MSMDIFPFIEATEEETSEAEVELPLAKEYAWDFDKQDFRYKNGKMFFVEGNEAIKVWLWKLFKTERFKEIIFSWEYGSEAHELIGQGYSRALTSSEAERYVREAIEYNLSNYVTDIRDFRAEFNNSERQLTIAFVAETPYGEVEYIE